MVWEWRYNITWKSIMERISLRHSSRNAAQTYKWKCEKPSDSACGKQKDRGQRLEASDLSLWAVKYLGLFDGAFLRKHAINDAVL